MACGKRSAPFSPTSLPIKEISGFSISSPNRSQSISLFFAFPSATCLNRIMILEDSYPFQDPIPLYRCHSGFHNIFLFHIQTSASRPLADQRSSSR